MYTPFSFKVDTILFCIRDLEHEASIKSMFTCLADDTYIGSVPIALALKEVTNLPDPDTFSLMCPLYLDVLLLEIDITDV